MTQRPLVLIVCPAAQQRCDRLAEELRRAGMTPLVHPADSGPDIPEVGEADALLLDLTSMEPEAAIQTAATYGRRGGLPIVVAGVEDDDEILLQMVTVGVADVLSAAPRPGELRARLLMAIERRATERELRRGYAAFRTLFEQAVSPILVADPEGRIRDANTAARELLGYSLRELRRLDVAAITHPEDADSLELFAELADGRRDSYRVRKRFVTKDGRSVWADLGASRVVEPDTGRVHLIGEFHNLTQEVETRRTLDHVRERYRSLFEKIPLAVLVIDLESMRFSEVNAAAERTYGYDRGELLELGPLDLWTAAGRAKADAEEMLRSERESGPTLQRHRRRDGSTIEVEVTSTRLEIGDRRERLLLARDVTAQRYLEDSLETARADAASGRLAAEVGHSINNLVNVLMGSSDRLLDDLTVRDADLANLLDIQRVGQRLAELTHHLMSVARTVDSHPQPLDLEAAVAGRLDLVRALLGPGVELIWKPAGEPLPIYFDPKELEQVLLNLASNARDAMEGSGRLTLSTLCVPPTDEGDGELVRLSFADTGRGMSAATAGQAFEPYFTTKTSGTGLGLNLVRRVVRQSGGRIRLDSRPGAGTTFHIELPLHRRAAVHEPPATSGETRGVQIALVDDDPAVCLLVREMLETAGHRVSTASCGREALKLFADSSHRFGLLIVDATLQDVPTPVLIARLRRAAPGLPVLIMSGYLEDVLIARGVVGSDTPFLSKPFSSSDLLAAVDGLLDRASP